MQTCQCRKYGNAGYNTQMHAQHTNITEIIRVAVRVQQELQQLVEEDFELRSRRGGLLCGSTARCALKPLAEDSVTEHAQSARSIIVEAHKVNNVGDVLLLCGSVLWRWAAQRMHERSDLHCFVWLRQERGAHWDRVRSLLRAFVISGFPASLQGSGRESPPSSRVFANVVHFARQIDHS
jgi:hypothetical protein